MNALRKYILILPLVIGVLFGGMYLSAANSRAYSFTCVPNMATKIYDIQINSGDLIGINTSQCLLYQQSGDIGIDPVHPVRDTSCVTIWCATGGSTATTAFGQAVVQLKSSSADVRSNWIIRVYKVGSPPPPIPQVTASPSINPTPKPKATPSVVVDPTQKGLAGQGETIGINQTAYTYCGYGKTNSGANSNGFTAASKITVKRGDVGDISISIIGIPRRVIWRFTPDTQVGFNSGTGDYGTLTVTECKATYKAPSVTSNPTVSLLVDVHAGVTAPTQRPSANGEQGPSAVGWLANDQIYVPAIAQILPSQTPTSRTCSPTVSIYVSGGTYGTAPIWIDGNFIADNQVYSRWSIGNHHVYITDGYGRVLVDRIYNSSCGLTQIKFG